MKIYKKNQEKKHKKQAQQLHSFITMVRTGLWQNKQLRAIGLVLNIFGGIILGGFCWLTTIELDIISWGTVAGLPYWFSIKGSWDSSSSGGKFNWLEDGSFESLIILLFGLDLIDSIIADKFLLAGALSTSKLEDHFYIKDKFS